MIYDLSFHAASASTTPDSSVYISPSVFLAASIASKSAAPVLYYLDTPTDLIDRLSDTARYNNKRPISIQNFCANLTLYALDEITAGQIAAEFVLLGGEVAQALKIKQAIDARATEAAKLQYVELLQAVVWKIHSPIDPIFHNADGTINKALVRSMLEL